jgi:hypothetical protein
VKRRGDDTKYVAKVLLCPSELARYLMILIAQYLYLFFFSIAFEVPTHK